MKRFLALSLTGLIATAAVAAQRDYSLSPGESFKQPDITRPEGANPFEPWHSDLPSDLTNNSTLPGYADRREQEDLGRNADGTPMRADKFMDAYCDPNFRPMVNARTGLSSCLQDLRVKACESFRGLPPDAQRVLDHAIDCAYSMSELEGAKLDQNCTEDDSRRIGLIKKYWEDRNTAHAIAFLPDMVLNGASFCMHGGHQ